MAPLQLDGRLLAVLTLVDAEGPALQRGHELIARAEHDFLEHLSADERRQFRELLEKVVL